MTSIHWTAAHIVLNNPALELPPEKARKLADAVHRAQAEFDVSVLSPKAAALVNLAIVAGGIYGKMAMDIFMQPKLTEKKPANETEVN